MKSIFLYGICLLFILAACKSGRNYEAKDAAEQMELADINAPAPPPVRGGMSDDNVAVPAPADNTVPEIVSGRKIIKDGRMEIQVRNLEQGKKDIDSLVGKFKGYYADETFNNMDYSRGYTLRIRIPSAQFETFIGAIEAGPGDVVFKNISSRDVTEEFIDLETRLSNKRNYLVRYGELLKQAKTVKDILEIQEKTRLIEEEMDSVQGRLKFLGNQIDFSTLDLVISKKNDYNQYSNNKGNFFDRLKMSLVKGWFGLVSFILFLIRIWPFWLIAGSLFYIIRRLMRNRKNVVNK